ncbi:MAG: dihydroorotate dehydrogenase electron transfer subunit [Firmicutes bacterium]|nr:dihydroorotate dehydrogenase electron transfer subunit [Bacillota bacterium]
MSQLLQVEIISNANPAPNVYVLELDAPTLAQEARPGQFLHLHCASGQDPLLRRPISIHGVNRQTGRVLVMFQLAGRGTALLAERRDGLLEVMGPLGHGFTLVRAGQTGPTAGSGKGKIIVLGGGIGAAPLFFLLQELAAANGHEAPPVRVLLGARSAAQLLTVEPAATLGYQVQIATDDGSAGLHGPVTWLLAEELKQPAEFVYACGPASMLKAVCQLLAEAGVPGEVALEERMACGIGACLSCVCATRQAGGEEHYRRVCVDGPVFNAAEVVWR